VARLYELANALGSYEVSGAINGGNGSGGKSQELAARWAQREAIEALIIMIAPMMPHLAEEAWHTLGGSGLVADAAWPTADAALLVEDTITIAVQLNGKMRATLDIARDQAEDEVRAAALALDKIVQAVGDKAVRRVIVVPNRIVNVVV
jgi:leucyl-tRNA synthetase